MQRLGTVLVLERFAAEYTQELPTIHERSITATFQVSWNQALDDAKEILRVMSQLAPAPVPLRLLRGVLEWPDSCSLDDRLLVGIRNLLRLSLVECDPQGQPTAHRLILGFVRQFGGADSRWAKTIDGVEREMDRAYSDSDVASSAEVDSVAPHAEIVLGRPDIPPEQGAAIAADLWRHYTTVGRYLAAAHNANTAATFAARCDPKMRDRRSNVATALDGWAELKEALDILRRARDSKKLRHLANMFMKPAESLGLRELDEARDLLRQVLVSAGLKYPISHPFNKFRLLNVKKVLNELPEFNDLLALLQRALESTKRRYAPGHPFIATSQYNLGLALGIRGELARARDLVQEALEAGERLNQSDQPLIAIQQGVLATLLKGLGEYAEARILAQKALQSTLCQFGPEHPETRHVKCLLKSLDDRKG